MMNPYNIVSSDNWFLLLVPLIDVVFLFYGIIHNQQGFTKKLREYIIYICL
ncbi:hypothetical protein JCM14036_31840 [Desulfotomaculum defluvii]